MDERERLSLPLSNFLPSLSTVARVKLSENRMLEEEEEDAIWEGRKG